MPRKGRNETGGYQVSFIPDTRPFYTLLIEPSINSSPKSITCELSGILCHLHPDTTSTLLFLAT